MKEEEILAEAKEIDKEIEKENSERKKSPMYYIIGIFLALIITAMIIPYYGIKINPEPKNIPGKEIIQDIEIPKDNNTRNSLKDYTDAKGVKFIADKIASQSCKGEKICQAKAIYYFIRDNYDYIADPLDVEYWEKPQEFLLAGGGDCESGSITLYSLMEAIGIKTQFVIIKGHAYNRIWLPEAINGYKIEENWIYLDWTCKNCEFGTIPYQNVQKEARYI